MYSSTTSLPCLTISEEDAALEAIFAKCVIQQLARICIMVTKKNMKEMNSSREVKLNTRVGDENINSLKSPKNAERE